MKCPVKTRFAAIEPMISRNKLGSIVFIYGVYDSRRSKRSYIATLKKARGLSHSTSASICDQISFTKNLNEQMVGLSLPEMTPDLAQEIQMWF